MKNMTVEFPEDNNGEHELDLIITVSENIVQEMPKEIWHYKIIQSLVSLYL